MFNSQISTFINYTDLPNPQASGDAYGAIDSQNYRVCGAFTISADSMAFAICDGVVLVQPQAASGSGFNPSLMNIVLRPLYPFSCGGVKIKYFIYRGLKTSDFITGTTSPTFSPGNVIASAPSNSDLIAKIWSDFNLAVSQGYYGTTGVPTAPSYKRLGLDQYTNNGSLDLVFQKAQIDTVTSQTIILSTISKGESLGHFAAGRIGFDVVLDNNDINDITLIDARKAENIITVAAPSGSPGNLPYSQMIEREKVLSYMDPAAFYMSYGIGGLSVVNSFMSGTSTSTGTPMTDYASIYNGFVNRFATKKTIYLDIRNEINYSLNYGKDNQGDGSEALSGNHFKIGINGATPSADKYYQNYWPVYAVNSPAVGVSGNAHITLNFWRTYNPVPVIFCENVIDKNGTLLTGGNKFIVDETYDTPAYPYDPVATVVSDHWSINFDFYFPATVISMINTPFAWYSRLYVNRRYVPTVIPSTAVSRDHCLDNLFGPIISISDMQVYATTSYSSQWSGGFGKRYINCRNNDKFIDGFEGMVESCMAVSATQVILYAVVTDINSGTYNNFIPGLAGLGDDVFIYNDLSAFEDAPPPFSISVQDSSSSPTTSVLSYGSNSQHTKISVCMTPTEYTTLYTQATSSFTQFHSVLIHFSDISNLQNIDPVIPFIHAIPAVIYYFRCSIHVAGIDSTGVFNATPNIFPRIYIRSLDLYLFSTSAAAASGGTVPDTIQNTPYVGIDNLIRLIQNVEGTYVGPAHYLDRKDNSFDRGSSTDVHVTLPNTDTFDKTLTRMRLAYYGLFSDMYGRSVGFIDFDVWGADYLFRAVIPASPIFDEIFHEDPNTDDRRRERKIYYDEFISYNSSNGVTDYQTLISQANENSVGDNPSPYILVDKPHVSGIQDYIDLGHTLYSFEAIFFAPTAIQNDPINISPYMRTTADLYFLGNDGVGSPNTGIGNGYKKYNIYHAYDLAGLLGDIGPAAGEYFKHKYIINKRIDNKPYYPDTPDLDTYFTISAPPPDLISDIDGIGLFHAYKALSGNTGLKLSDIFTLYYKGSSFLRSGIVPSTTITPYYTKEYRWFIFSKYLGFLKQTGTTYKWLPVLSTVTPSSDWKTIRDTWRLRMFFFVQMWINAITNKKSYASSILFDIADPDYMQDNWPSWKNEDTTLGYTSPSLYPNPIADTTSGTCRQQMRQVIGSFFEDKFLDTYVKPNLQNEIIYTGITITF